MPNSLVKNPQTWRFPFRFKYFHLHSVIKPGGRTPIRYQFHPDRRQQTSHKAAPLHGRFCLMWCWLYRSSEWWIGKANPHLTLPCLFPYPLQVLLLKPYAFPHQKQLLKCCLVAASSATFIYSLSFNCCAKYIAYCTTLVALIFFSPIVLGGKL